jgi:3-isopropylmalate dehydratase small subunit
MIEPMKIVSGRAIPLGLKNVDTDMIIPARWLKTVTRAGLGEGAFEALRQSPDNIFDAGEYAGAPILIAGDNFGCGSSREHAAWAMLDLGLQVVIAPSFSDIFASNAFKNGLLTIDDFTVDLEAQHITTSGGSRFGFELDPFRKRCLLGGLDEIEITLNSAYAIAVYEELTSAKSGWRQRPKDSIIY